MESVLTVFGIPQSVHTVRGLSEWQDDVVFVYNEADFYIFRDTLWQLGLRKAYGIKTGDTRTVAALTLSNMLELNTVAFLQCSVPHPALSVKMRANIDRLGLISTLFVYRSDY